MCKGRHSLPHWIGKHGVWLLWTRSVHVGCSWHQWDRWDGDMAWLPRLGPGHHHCFSRDSADVPCHLGTTGIQTFDFLVHPSSIFCLVGVTSAVLYGETTEYHPCVLCPGAQLNPVMPILWWYLQVTMFGVIPSWTELVGAAVIMITVMTLPFEARITNSLCCGQHYETFK